MYAMVSRIIGNPAVFSVTGSGWQQTNIIVRLYWYLWGEFTTDRHILDHWIPSLGQLCGKRFYIMMSSWEYYFQDSGLYENWKFSAFPSVATVLSEFPSLRVSPTFLLSQLPLLQPRFYSISSSPAMHPGEIHATVAVVCFTTQGVTWKGNDAGICINFGLVNYNLSSIPPETQVRLISREILFAHWVQTWGQR